mmetsp:Transcript_3907/g.5592  ORF Transcript_3907/g.5592 Transcript_3907/m.5592 type:complete len:213 (+) Transcript_3907:43-681(+)
MMSSGLPHGLLEQVVTPEPEKEKDTAGLTPGDKKIIRRIWGLLQKDMCNNGMTILNKLFEIAPGALKLFRFRYHNDLMRSFSFKAHSYAVMNAMDDVIKNLDDLNKIVHILRTLGKLHAEFKVEPIHFLVFRAALLMSLKGALNDVWTHEVETAWTRLCDALDAVMKKALIEEIQLQKTKEMSKAPKTRRRKMIGKGVKFSEKKTQRKKNKA